MKGKILIVDDEPAILSTLKGVLNDEGIDVELASSAEAAMPLLKDSNEFQVILLDIWMDGMDGMELLDWIKTNHPDQYVIMMSGHGSTETAVKATKLGAYDFIDKPLSLDKLLLTISHAFREQSLKNENEDLRRKNHLQHYDIIGKSEQIQEVRDQIKLVAPSDGWVLINGENGTGKELVARQIHMQSMRAKKSFVAMNCAAIPEELIESELFGHEKGAFTGAVQKKIGKFDQANGGTLFLDEIGDMSLHTQAKILRVLQEQSFERVGGSDVKEVDVRIIAASNKDLQEEIKKGNFREDLYFRLNVIPIELPALKTRKEDIPVLVNFFLAQYSANYNAPLKSVSPEAMKVLEAYNWPGNIRELKNIVERMVILVSEKTILANHVPPAVRAANQTSLQLDEYPQTLKGAKEQFEKMFISKMLEENNWNISKTAEEIQLERSNLHKKIKQLEIAIPKESAGN